MLWRFGVFLSVLVVVAATTASAGGAVWDFDRPSYRPGEEATASTAVSWNDAGLGQPEDGPYLAYIHRTPPPDAVFHDEWPFIPAEAMQVGEVEIGLGPIEEDGVLTGPNHAVVRFTVPDVPPGQYDLLHCNVPCTTTFADITWGQFVVTGEATAPTDTTATTAVTTTATTSTTTTAPTAATAIGVATGTVAAAVTAAGVVGWRRGVARRRW